MENIKRANVHDKRVLVRVDYNVPIEDNKITDDTRILSSLETIKYLVDNGAKIILLSHRGRVKSKEDKEKNSLEIVAKHLSTLIDTPVYFVPVTRGDILEKTIENLEQGEIVLVENTRFEDYPKSLESSCDEALSKYWASLCDIYVLDAFASCHRCHASTYGISKYVPSYCGFLVDKEISTLKKAIHQRKTMILGGSKVEDKIGVIDNLINTSDKILLGGAMCFAFLNAKGYNTFKCDVSEEIINYAKGLLESNGSKIILPVDFVTENGVVSLENMTEEVTAYDIGPKTVSKYKEELFDSNLILWNGPLGKYEEEKYENGTKNIMKYLYNQSIPTILAGGDIVACSSKFNIKFNYISTGGGATLEFLEGKRFKTLERLQGDKK